MGGQLQRVFVSTGFDALLHQLRQLQDLQQLLVLLQRDRVESPLCIDLGRFADELLADRGEGRKILSGESVQFLFRLLELPENLPRTLRGKNEGLVVGDGQVLGALDYL